MAATENQFSFTTENRPLIPRGTHRTRDAKRAARKLTFVGVDGEGVNLRLPDGSKVHRYVMLSVGDETLHNPDGLTHHEIFPFLYEQFQANPTAVYVGFYLGYDFAMWLKSLPESRGRALFTSEGIASRKRNKSGGNTQPFPVEVGDWEIDILGMKRFMLRPIAAINEKPYPWQYICDTGAYFQASFLSVCKPGDWPEGHRPCTEDEYELIRQGKNERATEYQEGDTSYLRDMVRYNQLENRVLGNMMSTLNQGFLTAGVRLARQNFYGPGQAIQGWLDRQVKESSKFLSHSDIAETVPRFALEAGWDSYYGGRFEIFYHGHIPGVSYEYDIKSAYPHVMRGLPCLCQGEWREQAIPNADITFVYGTFTMTSDFVGALPLRLATGSICFPKTVTGWYNNEEVSAGANAGLIANAAIERVVSFKSSCGHASPLAGLANLFDERMKVGTKTPHGKAIKLMLNSAYGKFAQSIGSPKYGNSVYASLITSRTRIMILEAIGTHPDIRDLLMVATDGVYFRTPHPTINLESVLGGWEMETKTNLTLMKPGVYWDDKARKNGAAAIKSRGISAKTLADNIPQLDHGFTECAAGRSHQLPRLNIGIPFSVTSPRLALARGKWETAGQVLWNETRSEGASIGPKRRKLQNFGPYLVSLAAEPDETVSKPYSKRFGFGETELDVHTWNLETPDGPAETACLAQPLKELNDE